LKKGEMKSVEIGWREKKYRDRNTEMKTKKSELDKTSIECEEL